MYRSILVWTRRTNRRHQNNVAKVANNEQPATGFALINSQRNIYQSVSIPGTRATKRGSANYPKTVGAFFNLP